MNKEISGVRIPKWANIGICIAGFVWGILAIIEGANAFTRIATNGSYGTIGTFYLLGGLAAVALGIYGLYLSHEEGKDVRLMRISLSIGAVYAFAWGIATMARSNLSSSAMAPFMVLGGLVILIAAAFFIIGIIRFNDHKTTDKTLDFSFGGAAILVIMLGASIFTAGVSGFNLVALFLGTFLCCSTGLSEFQFGGLPEPEAEAE